VADSEGKRTKIKLTEKEKRKIVVERTSSNVFRRVIMRTTFSWSLFGRVRIVVISTGDIESY